MNGRDVNFVIREKVHSVTGMKYYIILIHDPWYPSYEDPDYAFWEGNSLGSLKFYVTPQQNRIVTLEIQDFIMRPEQDEVSSQKDKIKLFKGLGRLMLCCVTHFLLVEKKEVTVESPVMWHLFYGSSDVSGEYTMSDEDDLDRRCRVTKIQLLEQIWSKFGFVKDDDDPDFGWFNVRSTVRDIRANCINEFALNQTAFGRTVAQRYATMASLLRLREELYARHAKRAKKGGEPEGEEEAYEDELEGELEGRRAFDKIHSDDVWRYILDFV